MEINSTTGEPKIISSFKSSTLLVGEKLQRYSSKVDREEEMLMNI